MEGLQRWLELTCTGEAVDVGVGQIGEVCGKCGAEVEVDDRIVGGVGRAYSRLLLFSLCIILRLVISSSASPLDLELPRVEVMRVSLPAGSDDDRLV